jgi:polysaccharide pyruvyl transferase WcaK-like protein
MTFERPNVSIGQSEGKLLAASSNRNRAEQLRIAIFSVKYSPNLGDGLLSECLEAELMSQLPCASVEAIDLAGRTEYVEGLGLRGTVLALLHHSPRPMRHLVVETLLGRKLRNKLQPLWRSKLRAADAVIIGGGNLLSDMDLNFPLKLDAAMAEVRLSGLQAAIFGVGVSDNWTERGEALFRRAFAQSELCAVSVREPRSANIWSRRLGPVGVKEASIVHDPGVLASVHFPRGAKRQEGAQRIGLGLTHPTALKYHTEEKGISASEHASWYVALARACLARGWKLAMFTDGSPEDEAYLARLRPKLEAVDPTGSIAFRPRFRDPADMAGFVSHLDLLIAHRLHANMAAYSYAIPQIGLAWDVKLKSFLAQVGRPECIRTVGTDTVDSVVELAVRQLADRVDLVRHRTILAQARNDVANLGAALMASNLRSSIRRPVDMLADGRMSPATAP